MAQVFNVSNYPLHQSLSDGKSFHIFPLGKGDNSFSVTNDVAQKDPVLVNLLEKKFIRIVLDDEKVIETMSEPTEQTPTE